jgi:lysophospholipase L1-like esterase
MRRSVLLGSIGALFARHLPARAATPGMIVFDGDSVSRGLGASPGQGPDDQLGRLLGHPARIRNVAVSGLPVGKAVAKFSRDVAPLFDAAAAFNVIAFHAGDNDIAAGRTAAEAYDSLTDYIGSARAQGWHVVVSTELARPDFPPDKQQALAEYNTLMRRNAAGADAVIDYAVAPGLAEIAREGSPFYNRDHVHPSDRGYGVLAAMLAEAIRGLAA